MTFLTLLYRYNVSSIDFEETKSFYGSLYEAYTYNLTFISCLHNIHKDRDFDKFMNMDLRKYLTIDKAKRIDNFKESLIFEYFSEHINSKLRNASHHENIEFKDGMIIYKAGKNLNTNTMSYTRFLEISMKLFMQFISILQVQLMINEVYKNEK